MESLFGENVPPQDSAGEDLDRPISVSGIYHGTGERLLEISILILVDGARSVVQLDYFQ